MRHKFYTLIIFIKFLNQNIKNRTRHTIEKRVLNVFKKIASKNIENCMSYHADRGGKSSFEKNAFKVLSAFCSKSRAAKARTL